tara:strand:+ start:113 stop:1096 length:984 start_codon:yes stop_codon:yes gene_type:complete
MRVGLIMTPHDCGQRWKSYEVRGGIPYYYGTDTPYTGGPQDSVEGHIFRNIWNRPFIGDGCFINMSQGLPDEKFDVIFLVYESDSDPSWFVKEIREKYKGSILIGTTKEAIPGLRKNTGTSINVGLGYLGNFYRMCDTAIIQFDQNICNELSEEIGMKVYSLPMNYKVEDLRSKYKTNSPFESKKILAGTTDWSNRGYETCLEFCRYLADKYDYSVIENTENRSWDEWLKVIDDVDFVINTDTQHRLGQLTIECIAMGTPHIGGLSDTVLNMIPEWATNDLGKLEEIFVNVRDNGYEKAQDHYEELVSKYSFSAVEKHLMDIIEDIS